MNSKQTKGFTLIELMIVVAIVGIIGAIAFPNYDSYIKKSRRADAKVGMEKIFDREERFYLSNDTYSTSMTGLGFTDGNSEQGYYVFSITSTDLLAFFTITAVTAGALKGAQAADTDTNAGDCTTMTLDKTGLRTPASCW